MLIRSADMAAAAPRSLTPDTSSDLSNHAIEVCSRELCSVCDNNNEGSFMYTDDSAIIDVGAVRVG